MTKDCIKMVLDHVLDNLRKYPQDKKSIWKSLEGVGKNHPWVILPLVPGLLSSHAFYDTPEIDPEEPSYVSVLILVFNAAKGCSTMATMFDVKQIRHYHYLRDTIPHLVPDLSIGNDASILPIGTGTSADKPGGSSVTGIGNNANGRLVLKELTGKLRNSQNLSLEMKQRLSKLILKDLKVQFQF